MSEVNWLTSLAIGALLSIPISIFANLSTPKIQNWLDKRALSTRGKRLEQLKKEHSQVLLLHNNQSLLQLTISRAIIDTLARLFFIVVAIPMLAFSPDGVGKTTIFGVLAVGALFFSDRLRDLARNLTRLIDFDDYDEEITRKIAELEKNVPESNQTPK